MDGIAVIIVNFNSGELLAHCLESLGRQQLAPRRIVVVDNASSDGSAEVAARCAGVELIREPANRGFAAAMNTGVAAAADCAWIAALNPDAAAAPDWIAALDAAIRADPDCASFACRLLDANAPDLLDGAGDVYHLSGLPWRHLHGAPDLAARRVRVEVFGPCAAGALYNRRALIDCGGFDADLFCYTEDVDVAFRLRLMGGRCIYLPEAVVYHVGSAIVGHASDFQIYHGHRNLVWVFVKNMPAALFWPLLPVHVALNLLTVAWFALRGRGGPVLRAKRDALRGLPLAWRKRREIQRRRTASARAIWQSLHKGLRCGARLGGQA